MIEIRIPKEIRDYKERWYFNLTARQLICVFISLSINVPAYYFGKEYVHPDLLGWGIIIITCVFGAIGFFEYNGMTFEKFLIKFIKFYLTEQKRLYKTECIYKEDKKRRK